MINAKTQVIWPVAVLLTTSFFCAAAIAQTAKPSTLPVSQSRKQEPKPNQTKKAEKTVLADSGEKPEERRSRQAQFIIENIALSLNEILNPIVRLKTKMMVGDAYWNIQPDRARELLSECFRQLAALSFEADDFGKFRQVSELNKATYKGRELDSVKSQLRIELLALISAHDSALARALLAEQAEKKPQPADDDDKERLDEMLIAARSVMQTDPAMAARIIRESGQAGLSSSLLFILAQLRQQSPAEASKLFNQLFTQARASGDLWDFQKLLSYAQHTEVERLTGKSVADPQFIKDRQMLFDYAITLLAGRVQSGPPGNASAELIRREHFLWLGLQQTPAFKETKPDAIPLLNTRLGQLATLLPAQTASRTEDGPWTEERLQRALATAKSSTGEKRDQALMAAAFATWRFGQGDLNQALALLDKIENRELREMYVSTIYFQACKKALQNEGPDQALTYANKINWPVQRAPLYVEIIAALRADKKTEQVAELQQVLLNWLSTCERNTDTVSALLTFFDNLKPGETERGLAALDILVAILNDASFELPANPVRGRLYWFPEFHDFKKSLAPLVRADFDGGWQRLEKLNPVEVKWLMQAAFCSEYLKLAGASRKPATKP